jgi:hypothetical protein
MEKETNPTATAILTIMLALLVSCGPLAGGGAARAQTFSDTGDQPLEIQEAIDHVTEKGYMNGDAEGNFKPDDPTGRLEYACAVVKMFHREGDEIDPAITFEDIDKEDPDYPSANLAVKNGYIGAPGGRFKPYRPITTAEALAGLVGGLGMQGPALAVDGIFPWGPEHTGKTVVAHDLHLKQRDTRAWPGDSYPRGEMAFSLMAAEEAEEWRIQYVNDSFDWLSCQTPIMGKQRDKALDSAFAKVGYPYVWGGESDAERGYDCSGLTYFVLKSVLGYPMMRTANDQAYDGRYEAVSRPELLAGDPIFFFGGDTPGYVGHAALYIGRDLFIHSTGSNAGVSVDRLSGYWESHFAWGKRVIDEPEPASFDTYILLANPGDSTASARLTYMLLDGRRVLEEVELEPFSRKTVRVDDTLVNQEFSVAVEALSGKVAAERAVYFDYLGKYPGGHDSPGVVSPSRDWFLAEGCTDWGFDTYVLLQNPSGDVAEVSATFMRDDGRTVRLKFPVGPYARYTIDVGSDVPGMEQAEFATSIESTVPIVAERSMYFEYGGLAGGHNSPGITELRYKWFLAEGYTRGEFDTYVLLANPNDRPARATMTLLSGNGERKKVNMTLGAHSRKTVVVDGIEGWEAREFSARITSTLPLAVERSMYFDYDGRRGGHTASACPEPAGDWFLAEGYTAGDFDTYILLANPGGETATVEVRYLLNGGEYLDRRYKVKAHSRFTIPVNKVKGLDSAEVSARIKSDKPIVVERSVYFEYLGRDGGTCAPGVNALSDAWYFAEGYTGR